MCVANCLIDSWIYLLTCSEPDAWTLFLATPIDMMKPAFHQFAHAVHILVRLSFNPVVEAEVITSGCQRLRGVIVARLPHEAVSSVYVE